MKTNGRVKVRAARITTGDKLRDIFLENGDVNPWQAYRALKATPGFCGSYAHVLRLFYACREIGLIEFSREEASSTPILKRVHRIVPGREYDPRWHQPMAELYPATSIGGLYYIKGTSQGRRSEYEGRVSNTR